MKNEKQYEVVGNIRIKQPKVKKSNKNKKNTSDTPLYVKIFVWFMFLAMAASFFGTLIYYLIAIITK